ncbi:MAG TPA: hypothetical protein VFY36_06630, partial [Solirubrobacteraceae bacterium]|nr:hypothetical protein [Solirubrobacteraceae bacterium]
TWARVGGVLLIAAGLLGMLLLLGFIAARLLTAAIFSLFYLLLAPAMVLAPAFGEGGRALFRKWAAQLLGAIVSKLLFSFLLGVVLAVLAILSDLSAIGWWTQWLLMSAFCWGAYTRRHQALGVVGGAIGSERTPHHSVVRRMSNALETRKAIAAVRWAKEKYARPAPSVEARRSPEPKRRQPHDEQDGLTVPDAPTQASQPLRVWSDEHPLDEQRAVEESLVMRDMREVAAGRRRHLGLDRD